MVFNEKPLTISEYLKTINRDWLIRFALLLIQNSTKYELIEQYISQCFCKDNLQFVNRILVKLNQIIQEKKFSFMALVALPLLSKLLLSLMDLP